ncbi:hypothetical protein BHM03_00055932 [Ensete ventricosum]|uniref:Uncharacterized protein n=1 Tax=Ensete ventricosum TaxID=4639 RepID=A0A445MMA9_ENSVE|nr:hypothetical protein BHM03_00055932 [Ensete ventricosum]
MQNPWNDMIPLLPLQEFMSIISIQGKFRGSTIYFIFYIDSLHATWILHQVPPKLRHPSIYIEFMVALAPTILWVSPLLSLIFTSALSVPSFNVVMVTPPLDLVMHPLIHYLTRDHATTPLCSLGPLSFVRLLS